MAEHFLNDMDKMYDFLDDKISREEFLESYSYLKGEDYDITLKKLNEDIAEVLAEIIREAENMLLEESNGRPTGWLVTGSDLKYRVAEYVRNHLTEDEEAELYELCDSMAC